MALKTIDEITISKSALDGTERFAGRDGSGDFKALVQAIADLVTGTVPIGSIIAWHKTLTGVPVLPDSFLECDGSVISDVDSPMNGQTLPDLNGVGRFLRGASTSGTEQADAFQGHHHRMKVIVYFPGGGVYDWWLSGPNTDVTSEYRDGISWGVFDPLTDGVNGAPRTGSETRPINMSVVWIMRIK